MEATAVRGDRLAAAPLAVAANDEQLGLWRPAGHRRRAALLCWPHARRLALGHLGSLHVRGAAAVVAAAAARGAGAGGAGGRRQAAAVAAAGRGVSSRCLLRFCRHHQHARAASGAWEARLGGGGTAAVGEGRSRPLLHAGCLHCGWLERAASLQRRRKEQPKRPRKSPCSGEEASTECAEHGVTITVGSGAQQAVNAASAAGGALHGLPPAACASHPSALLELRGHECTGSFRSRLLGLQSSTGTRGFPMDYWPGDWERCSRSRSTVDRRSVGGVGVGDAGEQHLHGAPCSQHTTRLTLDLLRGALHWLCTLCACTCGLFQAHELTHTRGRSS